MDEKQEHFTVAGKLDPFVIVIFPILLAVLNSNWIFSPATDFLPDPWFYLGYFRYFDNYAPAFPSNIHYFVERISWIVPGYYVYKIFPPLLANYFLHLGVCYLGLFSLYNTLSLLFNRRTALLTTLLMGGYPWYLRAVGWDYVDGIGISLLLFLLYILTKNKHSNFWRIQMLFSGVIHAALLVTNLFWLGFTPAWVTYYLYINRPHSKEDIWELVGKSIYFIFGNLVLIILTALYYHSITERINFLQNSLAYTNALSHDENIINFITIYYGNMPPVWHILPVCIAACALWQLRKLKTNKHDKSFIAVLLFFVFSYGWLIFWHFYALPYLIVFLYSSFLIPSIFLLLGGLLSRIVEDLSNKLYNVIIGATILILIVQFLITVVIPKTVNLQGNLFLLTLFSIIFVLLFFFRKNKITVWSILISLSSISFLTALNSHVLLADPLKGRNNFLAIINSSNLIDEFHPDHDYSDFRLWYRKDLNYDVFFNLSALYLYPWGSAINDPVSGKTPADVLSVSTRDKFKIGDKVIILSSNPNTDEIIAEANHALSKYNIILKLDTIRHVQEGSVRFILYFTRTETIKNE
jgi:hypothetical protein